MEAKKIKEFYSNLINGKDEVCNVFEEYINDILPISFSELQENFHKELRNQFETIKFNKNESGHEEELNIPSKIKERVQIVILVMSMMVMGAKYSPELCQRAINIRLELEKDRLINAETLSI